MKNQTDLTAACYAAACELCRVAGLRRGDILVVGCSTSEVVGETIGKGSDPTAAEAILSGLVRAAEEHGVFLAVQCCEHLNRALVVERAAVPMAEPVNAVPQPKAGGSLAAAAYARFSDPVVIETIRAHAGLDIGDTLIGMHLKRVAVPVRLSVRAIGQAHLTAARTRPPFIGGCRAVYDEELL
ncbi:MAG: TIGR01440 family protein [Clostridia bacterium]|nr:TIGR01440 family protein [Clostridia bacterium]